MYSSFCRSSSSRKGLMITQIWYIQTPPKPGHLEMILMDSKGDKIQVSVRKDEFNQWSQCLLENNTYVMHNFNVLRSGLQYKACDHVYRMQFTPEVIGVFDKLVFTQTQSNLKKCTKKADVKDGPFTCKCDHFNQNSTPRYKLDIKVNHEHSCGRFVLWDRQCVDIIGVSPSELKNQMLAEGEDDPKSFPLVLDELLARTMVLRVKVQLSYNQSSVIRLSEDVNLIKKVLDQIGVFESVSMTADHDPEQFQVVTSAKRLSAEFNLDLLQSPDFNSTQLSSSKMTKLIKTE
ncbi:hypothetical protein Lal_00037797 [Lupinus albus]|nr:hypothetical protein Lal_00037797 [Lupinus albus]